MDLLRIFAVFSSVENYHNGAIFLKLLLVKQSPIQTDGCILKISRILARPIFYGKISYLGVAICGAGDKFKRRKSYSRNNVAIMPDAAQAKRKCNAVMPR